MATPSGKESVEVLEPKQTAPDEHAQTRMAIAALFAALARSMHAQGKCDLARFDAEIERTHFEMADGANPPLLARQMLRWAHKFLRASEEE